MMKRGIKPRGPTDAVLINEGMTAYHAGQLQSGNPYGNPNALGSDQGAHHRAFLWRMGWGRGHFAEHGGTGVPLYTGIPSDCTPQMIDERKRADVQQRRRAATPLPWTMDELIGSVWVNTWTARMGIVTALYCNRAGQPEPGWQCRFSDVYAWIDGPGIWLERSTIDDWLRFDTMSSGLQDLWQHTATRRAFTEMQQAHPRHVRKQSPVRAQTAVTPTEEANAQQLTLF